MLDGVPDKPLAPQAPREDFALGHRTLAQREFALAAALDVGTQGGLVWREHHHPLPPPRNPHVPLLRVHGRRIPTTAAETFSCDSVEHCPKILRFPSRPKPAIPYDLKPAGNKKALHEQRDLLQSGCSMIRTGKTSSQATREEGLLSGEVIPHRLYHFLRKLVKSGPISAIRTGSSEENFIGKVTSERMGAN